MSVSLLRRLTDEDIRCPAGERVGDSSCICGVEQQAIDGRRDPSSLVAFCMGDYTACPSWQRQREDEAARRPTLQDRVREAAANRSERRAANEAKQARLGRASELMQSDTDEGRKFRARVDRVIRAGIARTNADASLTPAQKQARRDAQRRAVEAIGARRVA